MIRFRATFKGLFHILGVNILIPVKAFLFFAHMAQLSRWIKKHKKLGYTDYYTSRFDYARRYKLYENVIENQKLDTNIDYLEFGVSKGVSFRWWIDRIKNPDARFYGFDTFTGLPEDWGPFKKGDMANENAAPEIEDSRHEFFQGLFQQTLLPFLSRYKSNKRKVIHMDADIYSATLYVLTLLTPFLKKGDVLFFDEFNVPLHEFKAFMEWTNSFYIEYEVLGCVNNYYQTAILLK